MKCAAGILFFVLLLPASVIAQSGADCDNAIPLTLDGVCRTYPTSSTTASPFLCSSHSSNTPVTYFYFTTNSTPDRVLINITAPTAEPCEVLMYTSPTCTPPISSSSMCFDDGAGIWAASHAFTFFPNTTYKLRVKTTSAGDITICASNYTPPNDDCAGAMALGPDPITDNNACHTAGPDVNAADLCAGTLENTAFYKFTVATTGVSIINLNNIQCDNGNSNNNNGFQVGFFTGTCGSLTPISCYSGSGTFVSATTDILTAGTEVYVAVDGSAGANCSYEINAINALVLAADIKNFAAWKKTTSNLLTWTSLREMRNDYFEIERSVNGRDFISIGRVTGQVASYVEKTYSLEDPVPPQRCYYRLKQVDRSGSVHYYNTILVVRDSGSSLQVSFQNPVVNQLRLTVNMEQASVAKMRIVSINGIVLKDENIYFRTGVNTINRDFSSLPAGNYLLEISTPTSRVSKLFVKANRPG